jgi:hypothetical protein
MNSVQKRDHMTMTHAQNNSIVYEVSSPSTIVLSTTMTIYHNDSFIYLSINKRVICNMCVRYHQGRPRLFGTTQILKKVPNKKCKKYHSLFKL